MHHACMCEKKNTKKQQQLLAHLPSRSQQQFSIELAHFVLRELIILFCRVDTQ